MSCCHDLHSAAHTLINQHNSGDFSAFHPSDINISFVLLHDQQHCEVILPPLHLPLLLPLHSHPSVVEVGGEDEIK